MVRALSLLPVATLFGCLHPHSNTFMWTHYDVAYEAHDALIHGSISRARAAGQWLATHPESDMPRGSSTYVREMQRYAGELADAEDLEVAALATAGIAQTCGECHQAFGPGPLFLGGGTPPPRRGDETRREMQRHSWAAARMWEGLVGPSDAAWLAGANVFRDVPLSALADSLPPDIRGDLRTLEDRVHELGGLAATASGADRSVLYGNLIATCTQCHAMVNRLP